MLINKKILRDSLFSTLLVLVFMFVLPAFFSFDIFEPIKDSLEDFQITDIHYSKIEDKQTTEADTNIVIIDIENLSNAGLAKLIRDVHQFHPKVVGINTILKKSNKKIDDLSLADAIKNVKNVVFSARLKNDTLITSDKIFMPSEDFKIGISTVISNDLKQYFTVRDFKPKFEFKGKKINSFGMEIMSIYSPGAYNQIENRNSETEIIHYRGNYRKFPFIEGISLVREGITEEFIRGKIILLGVVGAFRKYDLLERLYFTPMNERFAGRTFPDMTGTEIQANIISMIGKGIYTGKMPGWVSIIIAIILCYANMIIFSYICVKNISWFELGSLLIFVIESLSMMALTVYSYSLFRFQFSLTEALFASALSIFAYQIYNDSLKPALINMLKKIT